MSAESGALTGWMIIEQLGHKRLAGFVTEAVIAGQGFLRIDVPGEDGQPAATQYIHPNTIYAITPSTEPTARRVAALGRPEPVHAWELPAARPSPRPVQPWDDPERHAEFERDDEDDDDEGPEL